MVSDETKREDGAMLEDLTLGETILIVSIWFLIYKIHRLGLQTEAIHNTLLRRWGL